jgi:uncharacterized protein DUF4375
MSIAEILKLEDDTAFALALSDLVFARGEAVGFEALTPAEQVAYCVDELDREVYHGGFHQYFVKSAGDQVREAVEALRWIGAEYTATLVERAMGVFPTGGPSPNGSKRCVQVEALGNEARATWRKLDGEFNENRDNLAELMRRYVRRRQRDFRGQ